MALKAIYSKQDEIPEKFRELYTEKDGKWELTGVEGVKTQADVDRVTESLRKEKTDHKATKEKLKGWEELEAGSTEEVRTLLDSIPELKARAEAGADEEKIKKIVEARVVTEKQPLERELKKLKDDNAKLVTENTNWQTSDRKRKVHDAVRQAAVAQKVVDTAVEDVLLYSEAIFEINDAGKIVVKDNVGFTPGIEPSVWLGDMQAKRPHWWPASQGGGATGSGGGGGGVANNPWSKDHWNLTEQGRYVNTHGTEKATQAAKSAGSFLGATAPAAPKK